MVNYKSVKWVLGLALTVGLSACSLLETQRPEHVDAHYVPMDNQSKAAANHKPVQKSYASKDPTQKATPGPTRKAAPQLPVIQ